MVFYHHVLAHSGGIRLAVLDTCFVQGEGGGSLCRKSRTFFTEAPWASVGICERRYE